MNRLAILALGLTTMLAGPGAAGLSGSAAAESRLTEEAALVANVSPGAVGVIKKFHAAVSRGAGETGSLDRQEAARTAVRSAFDSPEMARAAVGQSWADLTSEQQAKLVQNLERFGASLYASALSIDGPVQTFAEEAVSPTIRVVRTTLGTARLDYRLHETATGWRVIDVVFDGISAAALIRAEMASLLRRGGMPLLLSTVDAKTAGLR